MVWCAAVLVEATAAGLPGAVGTLVGATVKGESYLWYLRRLLLHGQRLLFLCCFCTIQNTAIFHNLFFSYMLIFPQCLQ